MPGSKDAPSAAEDIEPKAPISNTKAETPPGLDRHDDAGHARYRVLETLTSTSTHSKLRAYDLKMRREVLLERLALGSSAGESIGHSLERIQAMSMLTHPNIVELYDVEFDGDAMILVEELVDGSALPDWLSLQKPSPKEVLKLFSQAGRGLAAAHRAGVMHGTLRPCSLLRSAEGIVKVSGIGRPTSFDRTTLADLAPPRDSSETRTTSVDVDFAAPTSAQAELVSPFAAPEVSLGGDVRPAVDQYSLCAAMWYALTGDAPFSSALSPRSLLAAQLRGPPVWPPVSPVPKRWQEALRKGLHPDPRHRWPSIERLLETLENDARKRRHRPLAVLGAAAMSVGAIAWGVRAEGRDQRCTGAKEKLEGVWE